MIVLGKDVRFEFVIQVGEKAIPTSLDIAVTQPNLAHTTEYDRNGATAGAVYVRPIRRTKPEDDDVMGSYKFTRRFDLEGLWIIELDAGSAGAHSIIHTEMVIVVKHTLVVNPTVFLF